MDEAVQIISAVPVLPARDFDETAQFYAQLGFREIERFPQGYMILRRDGAELHFWHAPESDPSRDGQQVYLRTLSIARLDASCRAMALPSEGQPSYTPMSLRPWGMLEAYLVDPNGNLLSFGSPAGHPDDTKDEA